VYTVELLEVVPNAIPAHSKTPVKIFGQGFMAPTLVFFGRSPAEIIDMGQHSITCIPPDFGAGKHLVRYFIADLLPGKACVTVYSGNKPSNSLLSFWYLTQEGRKDDKVIDLPLDSSDIMFNSLGYA
jgi:hypothetical protein